MAIEQALTILSWFENMSDEDRPPEYLWEDEQGLEMWWKTVEDRKGDGMDTSRGITDHDQDDQAPRMTENDHARFLKQAMS